MGWLGKGVDQLVLRFKFITIVGKYDWKRYLV